MKKIVVISIVCAMSLYAAVQTFNNMPSQQLTSAPQEEQKKISTKHELQAFINTLETAYKLGDKSKGYLLGGIYSQEHQLDDGIVEANIPTAMRYFQETLDAGYGIAAWHIVMLDNLPKKEYFKALDLLEQGMNAKFIDKSAKISLALTFGTVVLENLNENVTLIRKARDMIYPLAVQNNLSSLDYVLANLLNLNGEINEANKFLNSACNNPAAPKEILNACMGGSEIVTSDASGQIIKRELSQCGAQ